MGCCGSKELSPGEKEEICSMAGKEMLLLCATVAMERTDDIKVAPPPEIAHMRKHAVELREQGDKAKANLTGGGAASASVAAAAGGGMAGMMGGMLAKAVDGASELAGKGIDMVCKGVADAMDKSVDTIENSMSKVGKELVSGDKERIKEIMLKVINSLDITSNGGKATELCRGAEPHGAAEYQACPGNALSAFLMSKVQAEVEAELSGVVGDAVKASTAVTAWNAAVTQYNALILKMGEMGMAKPEPVTIDLPKYIVAQTVASICDVMGKEEAEVRKDPAKERAMKPEHPVTFAKVFSTAKLDTMVYAGRAS